MMSPQPRMTVTTQVVLGAFLQDPARELYGSEITAAAGLRSGTIHPILARLEGIGWLDSRWEQIDARVVGRPPRRYYRLTSDGAVRAAEALAHAHRPPLKALRLRPGEPS